MCERARRKGITEKNIKAAWATCRIYPFNKIRVLSNPKVTLLQAPARESHTGLRPQSHRLLTEVDRLITEPQTFEEAKIQNKNLIEKLHSLKAQLSITKVELYQAMSREKPAQKSRRILSTARYITQQDLEHARASMPEPKIIPKLKCKAKAQDSSTVKHRRKLAKKNKDIITAFDSNIEWAIANFDNSEEIESENSESEPIQNNSILKDISHNTRLYGTRSRAHIIEKGRGNSSIPGGSRNDAS
jgi:hypothetical protein